MTTKGYKAMNPDMTCRGFRYAVGQTYRMDGPPSICRRGFHFCKRVTDVFKYYDRFSSIVFEVEALGEVDTRGDKSCTDAIRIVRRLDPVEEGRLRCCIYYGYGDGNGYGSCYDYGDGYGYDNGYGNGYGSCHDYDDDNGCGYGWPINHNFVWEE